MPFSLDAHALKRVQMKRGVLARRVAIASLALGAISALPASAQTTVQPEPGLDHYYKAQRWMPLRLTLMNQGPPTKVEVRARFSSGSEGAQEYRLPERDLQSSANRAHTLYMRAPFHYSTQPITVDLYREGKRINRMTPSLALVPDGEWLIAGIGPGATTLKQLTTLNLTANQAAPSLRPAMYRGSQNSRFNVAVLETGKVPDRWQGLDAADVVVLSGVSQRDFSPDQLTALRDYVCSGGRLIVTGGVNWNRLATPFFNDLLPVTVTGGKTVQSLSEATSITRREGIPTGAIPIVVSTAKPGARVKMGAGGSPGVVTGPKGMGFVTFIAFDPSLPPLKNWDHLDDFWREIILDKPAMSALQAILGTEDQNETYGYNIGLQRLADSPFAISQLDIPAFYIVAFFLLSYIIVLVPVNYFVLKARDKKEYAWLTTPLIVAVFTVGAYMIGYGFKGGRSLVVKVGVVEAREGQDTAPSMTYAGLFSPRKTGYALRLDPNDVTGQSAATLLSEPFDDRSKERLQVSQDEAQRIEDFSVDMWAMRVIRGDGLVRIGKGVSAAFRPNGKQVTGTIRNDTPFTLESCFLVHQNQLTPLETLGPGRIAEVKYDAPTGPAPGSILPGTLLTKIQGNSETSRIRRALLTPLCGSTGPAQSGWGSPTYPILVGWIKEPLTPLQVDDRAPREQAANLMIVHLGP